MMEEQTVIIWSNGTPAMISQQVADKHGLTRGSQVADTNAFNAIVEENTARNVCSIESQRNGEECITCGS